MLALAVLLVTAANQAPALPEWLAGCWETRTGSKWTEECWTAPRGGMMMGSGRSGDGEKIGDWEVMQIILDRPNGGGSIGRMAFYGAPQGMNRTMFAWSPTGEVGISFFNAAHDYPQRIRYWRDGDALVAEVALKNGSKARRWRYSRVSR